MVTFGFGQAGVVDAGSLQVREAAREVVSSGFRPLDSLLPAGGIRRGSLVEWLAAGEIAAGAATLAAAVACQVARADQARDASVGNGPRTILVVDRSGWFHPPALLPWLGREGGGVQLFVARPSRDEDEIWAIDQALRCSGVAAVLAWPRMEIGGRSLWPAAQRRSAPHARQQWSVAMRRWQLAARSSGAVGLFIRSAAASREPSWAETRIAVAPLPGGTLLERRLLVERAGGAWSVAAGDQAAAATGRGVEIVLDLARGGAAVGRAVGGMRSAAAVRERGVSCRAS